MSNPTISDINPEINIVRDDAINIIMASIAMEELALAHILNAQGEKLQYILGTLAGSDPGEVTICDIMSINNSVHKMLRDVIKEEMLLQMKLEDAIELAESGGGCQLTIRGQKIWRDSNNAAGLRPATVDINLLRDGEIFNSVTVDSAGDGTYAFTCLPVWRDSDNRYTYQVDEAVEPADYIKTISGYNITNTIRPGSINIEGTKIWVDNDNVRGERPAEITVRLLQNGVEIQTAQVAVGTDNTVTFEFTGVPRFDDQGAPFVYTVDEVDVAGYGKSVDNATRIITNTISQVFDTIAGEKVWDDNDNQGGLRQDITVNLLQNGVQYRNTQVARPQTDTESRAPFSFTNVPRYDAQNVPYTYTVEESAAITGYDTTVNAFEITNTLI